MKKRKKNMSKRANFVKGEENGRKLNTKTITKKKIGTKLMKYRSPFERLSRAIKSESQLFYKRAPMYVCVYFSEQVSEYTGRLSCFSSKVI